MTSAASKMPKTTSLAILLLTLWLSGCASYKEQLAADAAEVNATLDDRLGFNPGLLPGVNDDGALQQEVRELLEGELTEEKAVKVAVLNNRNLRAAYEELGISRADLLQAGLLRNPVFDANAKFFRGATEIELGLAQSFLEMFYIPLRRAAAEAELAAAKATVAREVLRTVFDLRRAFVRLRGAEQVAELSRQVHEAALASFDLMTRLHTAGNVTDPQRTTEESVLRRAKLNLAAADSAVIEAREPVNVLLGLWGDAVDWRISGRLPEAVGEGFDLEHVEKRSIASSLDLSENRAEINAAAQRVGLSSWEGWLAVGEIGPVAKQETGEKWGFGPQVSLSLPIFDQGQARTAHDLAELRKRLARQVFLAVEVRSAARALRERTIALGERAEYARGVYLPVQARLVRETLQNFNAMQIGVFDVLLARQQEVEAGREYLELLRDAWLARLDLAELLAGSLNRERLSAAPGAGGYAEAPQSMRKGH